MAVTTHYTGTPAQLAEHLRWLAEQAEANATSDRLAKREQRFYAGRLDGLRTAADIVANFTPTPEEH